MRTAKTSNQLRRRAQLSRDARSMVLGLGLIYATQSPQAQEAADHTWTGNFTKPRTATMTWPNADAYCKGLTPAARLPTRVELQNFFVTSTSASAIYKTNFEMCDYHGWPLVGGRCGGSVSYYWTSEALSSGRRSGHYLVIMHNAIASYGANDHYGGQVTCVR